MGRMIKDLTTSLKNAFVTRRNSFHGLETPGKSLEYYVFVAVVVPGGMWTIQRTIQRPAAGSCATIGRVRKHQTKDC